jgi:hypothetical protein
MKPRHLLLAAAVLSATSFASATPVKYDFTGFHADEYDATGPLLSSDYLFENLIIDTTSFFYDGNTPVTYPNINPAPFFSELSLYDGSISGITGDLMGYSFSADSGATFVGNSNIGDSTFLDAVISEAGSTDIFSFGTGFKGFDYNGFSLTAWNLQALGGWDFLANDSLPSELTNGSYGTNLVLTFSDANKNERTTIFAGSLNRVASVPEPSPLWLLMAGMLGLFGFSRYRKI